MHAHRGFTLMEIMVTVSILAVGLMPILQAFSSASGAFGVYADSLDTAGWFEEKIWETRHDLMVRGDLSAGETEGQEIIGDKEYKWTMRVAVVDPEKDLYKIDLTLSWKRRQLTRSVARTAYALAPMPEKSTQTAVVP